MSFSSELGREAGSSVVALRSFSKLCGDLLDGSILGLWHDQPDVQDEEDLDDDEDDEDVGPHRQLNKQI